MFCSSCGNQLHDNARFCDKCGAKQDAASVPTPPIEPITQPVAQEQYIQSAPPQEQPTGT
ncbi:MAG: zinc ribbon domain-containing protein, partial [Oscillospiraceae bacterium]|nr:zinc ribbon domain-containing protein [Oscillospiraceae bacterium]